MLDLLSEKDLIQITGGKINWGSVVGQCIAGGIIGGAFSGPAWLAGAGIGCAVGVGNSIVDGL